MRRWLVLAVLAACGDNAPPPVSSGTEVVALPVETTAKLDVLFVVDNEDSTLEHEIALVNAFPALLAQLSIDGRPDLHLGAVSPDLGVTTTSGAQGPGVGTGIGSCHGNGDGGALHQYHTTIPDRFLIDNAEASNHPNTLARDTEAILDFGGGSGCGVQQHLSAARAAFENPLNVGFRRPDAALGIVVLADEDDCSVLDPEIFGPPSPALGALSHFRCTRFGVVRDGSDMTSVGPRTNCVPNATSTEIEDPADFVDAFRAQVADPRRFSFGAIIAPSTPNDVTICLRAPSGSMSPIPALAPSCEWEETSNDGNYVEEADPSIRLAWLANRFGDRGSIGSICSEDITPAATTIGIGLRRAMGDPCVEDDVPLGHCTAVDELAGVETPVPPCGVSSASCWELVTDETTCPNAAHRKLVVHRVGAASAGTYTLLRC